MPSGGGTYYRCRRSLLEIKTPYKLRNRMHGGDFYPSHRQRNGQKNHIPGSYYDQVMGNCFLMGCDRLSSAKICEIARSRTLLSLQTTAWVVAWCTL